MSRIPRRRNIDALTRLTYITNNFIIAINNSLLINAVSRINSSTSYNSFSRFDFVDKISTLQNNREEVYSAKEFEDNLKKDKKSYAEDFIYYISRYSHKSEIFRSDSYNIDITEREVFSDNNHNNKIAEEKAFRNNNRDSKNKLTTTYSFARNPEIIEISSNRENPIHINKNSTATIEQKTELEIKYTLKIETKAKTLKLFIISII